MGTPTYSGTPVPEIYIYIHISKHSPHIQVPLLIGVPVYDYIMYNYVTIAACSTGLSDACFELLSALLVCACACASAPAPAPSIARLRLRLRIAICTTALSGARSKLHSAARLRLRLRLRLRIAQPTAPAHSNLHQGSRVRASSCIALLDCACA